MPVNKFLRLTIWSLQKEAISDLRSVQGALQRNQQHKLGILLYEKEDERKNTNS